MMYGHENDVLSVQVLSSNIGISENETPTERDIPIKSRVLLFLES